MTLPLPMVTLLNCEKNSPTKLKLVKEVMVIPPVELSLKQVLFPFLINVIDIILTTYVHNYIGLFNIVLTNYIFHSLLSYKARVLTDVRAEF